MDPDRRKQLEAKRAAAREKAADPEHQPIEGDIVPRLRERGIPHRVPGGGVWTPPFLKVTSTRIFWEGSPPAARAELCETLQERVAAVRNMLEQVAGPEDLLRFSYDGWASPVEIGMADALPVLDILLDEHRTIWITSKPKNWLIECGDYNTVQLALPPPVDPQEQARKAARDRAYVAPLARALAASGQPFRLFAHDDPERPAFANLGMFRGLGWSAVEKTLSAGVARGEYSAVSDCIAPFIAGRAPGSTEIVVELFDQGAPKLVVAADALLEHVEPLIDTAIRYDPDAPGGEISLSMVHIYESGSNWLVEISANGPYWTVRGTG